MANKIFDQSKRQLITLAVASSVSWLAHLCLPITHAHAAENSKKLKIVKKASSVKNTQTIKKGQSLTPNP